MILFISHFGFEGGILDLILPGPGHCLPVTSTSSLIIYQTHRPV